MDNAPAAKCVPGIAAAQWFHAAITLPIPYRQASLIPNNRQLIVPDFQLTLIVRSGNRAMLATRPSSTGSSGTLKTIGIVAVAFLAASAGLAGVGFLGDAGKFVSNGRNRVAHMMDSGTLAARVVFSAGERRLHLYGFSLVRPAIQARRAAVENLAYGPRSLRAPHPQR